MSLVHVAMPHALSSPPQSGLLVGAFRWLDRRQLAVGLSLACAAIAVLVGIGTPALLPIAFLEEGGPVEQLTVYLYVLAALAVALTHPPSLTPLDKAAIGLLLLAFAAREADLHTALFGKSILKASFYHRHATPGQIVVALLILLPVALSLVQLLKRHGSRWLSPPASWQAPLVTVMTLVVLLAVSKVFDRLPAVMVEIRLVDTMPAAGRNVLLALEEILELTMPLLALLAVVQGRRRGHSTVSSSPVVRASPSRGDSDP